jgi:hypothetical protein
VERSARRAQAPLVQPEKAIPPEPVIKAVALPKHEIQREPDFPFKYIGHFGPEQNPIAVFVSNGDVVNARAGDLIADQFRLSAVRIESVEIASGSGVLRRVSLQP